MVETGRASEEQLTIADLHTLVRHLALVPIPEQLAERVLKGVCSLRASLRQVELADLELADVVTAQPYRADESGDGA